MDMSSFSISVSYEITSGNEEWRGVIDNGMGAPEVTGGTIQLPQGGERESQAAATGGIFTEGSEAGSQAEENARKIIDSLLPEEIPSHIEGLLKGEGLDEIEFFFSNIAKSEYMKVAGEYSDNPDEAEATEQVINSLHVKLTISGMPTMDEIKDVATKAVIEMLGGMFK